MISPWLNITVQVQRRLEPVIAGMNALNEPDYGADPTLPIIYPEIWTRIDYDAYQLLYTETGERVSPGGGTFMIVEPEIILRSQDRVTVLTADNTELIGTLYIIREVYGEWDTVGNLHHRVASLQGH